MKPERWQRLRGLYEDALERPPAEREAWLREACADDSDLLGEALGMVAASADTATGAGDHSFLSPLPDAVTAVHSTGPLPAGTHIGSFELGPRLAAGGMGTVYEAWQAEPRRKVALKLLHHGLTSASAVRRFRFEAELLARLQHPGIAPVHEAGVHTAPDGQEAPYIALEFVEDAQDIVEFARGRRLNLAARIELLLQVCAAVQHGHQQGVVHRDLKPQNILVDPDGRVRVIDFGIARTIDDGPAPETQLTHAGEILGTLAYMSPEQFRGDSDAIDTRSDVYALGVVLHELACGRPPLELDGCSLVEITRIVQEHEVALPAEVPTDLGWIALKALAKEPSERYASASELAADLERFLADAPVEAGAPSSTYRLKKFVRRNRVAVGFSGLAALALMAGAITAFLGLVEAKEAQAELALERDTAQAEASKFASISDVLGGLFVSITPDQNGRDVRVADLLDRASAELSDVDDPEVEAALRRVVGRAYGNLGLFPNALSELESARGRLDAAASAEPELRAELRTDLVRTLTAIGRPREALELARIGLSAASAELSAHDHRVFELSAALGDALLVADEVQAAIALLTETIPAAERALGPDAATTLDLSLSLGRALGIDGRASEARAVLINAAARSEEALGADAPRTLETRFVAARQLNALNEYEAALAELESLALPFERAFGQGTARTCKLMAAIAHSMTLTKRYAEANALLELALPCLERTLATESPDLISARTDRGRVLDELGDDAGSLTFQEAAWRSAQRLFGPDDLRTLAQEISVADQRLEAGDPNGSLELAQRVSAILRANLGPAELRTLEADEIYANGLLALGRLDEALEIQQQVFETLTRSQGPEDTRTLRSQNAVTSLLARTGRSLEALEEGERMLAAHRRAVPFSEPSHVVVLKNLGLYAFEAGQTALMLDYFEQAYEHAAEHLPEDHRQRIDAAMKLAVGLRMQGDFEGSLSYFRESIAKLKRRPGSQLVERIDAHGGAGLVLASLGRIDEAQTELETAIAIADQAGLVEARDELSGSLEAILSGR